MQLNSLAICSFTGSHFQEHLFLTKHMIRICSQLSVSSFLFPYICSPAIYQRKSSHYKSYQQRSNFSSKAIGKIIAEAEAKKNILPRQCLSNFFANVIEQISVFALAIPSAVFGSYFGNFVLFNESRVNKSRNW